MFAFEAGKAHLIRAALKGKDFFFQTDSLVGVIENSVTGQWPGADKQIQHFTHEIKRETTT